MALYYAVSRSGAVMDCPSCEHGHGVIENWRPYAPDFGAVGLPSQWPGAVFGRLGYLPAHGGEVFVCWRCGGWFIGAERLFRGPRVTALDYDDINLLLSENGALRGIDANSFESLRHYLALAESGAFNNTTWICDENGIPMHSTLNAAQILDEELAAFGLRRSAGLVSPDEPVPPPPAPPHGFSDLARWRWWLTTHGMEVPLDDPPHPRGYCFLEQLT